MHVLGLAFIFCGLVKVDVTLVPSILPSLFYEGSLINKINMLVNKLC